MNKDLKNVSYKFSSVTYKNNYSDRVIQDKCTEFDDLLEKEIERLNNRLNELREVRKIIKEEKQFYLLKDNDSNYLYVNSNGDKFEYMYKQGKPLLIGEDLSLYEIIAYSDVATLTSYYDRKIKTYVDKIVYCKKIC